MACSFRSVVLVATLLALGLASWERESSGRVKHGASGLEVMSNDTIGEEMFELKGNGSGDASFSFGIAKIVELAANGTELNLVKISCSLYFSSCSQCTVAVLHLAVLLAGLILAVLNTSIVHRTGHICDFRATNITCESDEEEFGEMAAVDWSGNSTVVNYTMVTRTCDLAPCGQDDASLTVRSYIMLNKGYICQPNCSSSEYQSPVFNGTAKWELELDSWSFCKNGTSGCNGELADKLKIFFSAGGKEGGKNMKPKKKDRKPFDSQSGKFGKYCEEKKEEMMDKNNMGDKDSNKNNSSSSGKKQKRAMGMMMSDKKGSGKCRTSMSSSFGDEPDDQDSYSFSSDDNSTSSSSTFRMFSMAVIDDTQVLSNGSGFVGPNTEEIEMENESGQKYKKEYITICVDTFDSDKTLKYDPTYDMDEEGGTTGDASDVYTPTGGAAAPQDSSILVILSITAALVQLLMN